MTVLILFFDANYGNNVLNIWTYHYIGYIPLGTCLNFEHAESSHLDSHVRSWVWIFIASICQSCLDTLFHFQTQKMVELVDRIDKLDKWRYLCNVACHCVVMYHSIYLRDWRELLTPESCLVYTVVLVDYGENLPKK